MNHATQPEVAQREIAISSGSVSIIGNLSIPKSAKGCVLFAHGSGSSRFSVRNRYVAGVLNQSDFGTLLIDLLTQEEEREETFTGRLRFDIHMLAKRLLSAVDWLGADHQTASLPLGLFGASTGAAAALVAAVERPRAVQAVVARGGRPDLAGAALRRVECPTLFIVGNRDFVVIELNKQAFDQLKTIKKLELVPHATHLFEEPGTLEQVAILATQWFDEHLLATSNAVNS